MRNLIEYLSRTGWSSTLPLTALLLTALCGCAGPQAAASVPSARDAAAQSPSPSQESSTSTSRPAQRVVSPPAVGRDALPRIDATCKVDSDCAVKDVGSCCGASMACVNADSPTDPTAVQAACKASGRMAACGFRQVDSCRCDQGSCVAQRAPVGDWTDGPEPQTVPAR